jgi:lipoprotein-releasing system permease protein
MRRLEFAIAWRYLRSRRGSRLLSLISIIAIGGVTVAVSALIVIIGVMNGLQIDLREKILVGSPDIRVLKWGEDIVMPDWKPTLEKVKAQPGVVAAAPFVLTQAVVHATKHNHFEPAAIEGIPVAGKGLQTTEIRTRITAGDFSFSTTDG